jgi:methionyl-tRNA formyltransferase
MMGTGTFAEPTLEALLRGTDSVVGVFTQPDREIGEKRSSTRQIGRGIKEIAEEKSVPVFQPININLPEGIESLRSLQPDLLVVAAYGQILSKDVLSISSSGAINVHASLLPKYRGAAPIAWAIYHGETTSGVTIIRMSIGLDAGEMLDQKSVEIKPDETAGQLEFRLAPIGANLALQTIERLRNGPIKGIQQDKSLVTKAPKLKKEDGLIDWSRSAEQVCCQVRAMQPWPSAYTYSHRQGKSSTRIIINRAVPSIDPASTSIPGFLQAKENRLLVGAGQGSEVEILELQPAGKKKMLAADFLRGYTTQEGDRFGGESA